MKQFMFILLAACALSCKEQSEGTKYGLLQKVSHKTTPCNYYEVQVSYEGGKIKSSGESSSYENTQDLTIDQAAFDTLRQYIGEKVIFEYEDTGEWKWCGGSKKLTFIKIKK